MTSEEIGKEKACDANIAPQYGVLQTGIILNKCLAYGIDYSPWANWFIMGINGKSG